MNDVGTFDTTLGKYEMNFKRLLTHNESRVVGVSKDGNRPGVRDGIDTAVEKKPQSGPTRLIFFRGKCEVICPLYCVS